MVPFVCIFDRFLKNVLINEFEIEFGRSNFPLGIKLKTRRTNLESYTISFVVQELNSSMATGVI